MSTEPEDFKATFVEEAKEILEELEESLMDLEKEKDDLDQVNSVFRNLHTLKGSGSMFGFDELSSFAHQVENIFHHVRKGKLAITQDLIDLSLIAVDHFKLFFIPGQMDEEAIQEGERILKAITEFSPDSPGSPAQEESPPDGPAQMESSEQRKSSSTNTYRIRFSPHPEILAGGIDLVQLLDELNDLGNRQQVAYLDNVPPLEELQEEHCYVSWDILLTTSLNTNVIQDVFIFVEDESDITIDTIDTIDESPPDDAGAQYKKLGHILVERGDLSLEDMVEVATTQKKFGEILVEKGLVESKKVESALLEQKVVRQMRAQKLQVETTSSIRVSSEKLDSMVDLVGELVILKSHLHQLSSSIDNRELKRISQTANRLIWELRDKSMAIRMAPIETCFTKLKRLVRDLSLDLGKEIQFFTGGGETELDKTIIDRLNDPLVHILRNCIDHGIESPENREKAGKNRVGNIHLSASHSGAHVLIVIKDDGKGIDVEAVRERALQNGLIKPEDQLSEKESLAFIFEPGFSMATTVTNVSGRGVGMDVVKKNIEALRGSIQMDTTKGVGTTITIKIPLTLVIVEGLLLKVCEKFFIIPLSMVDRIIERDSEHLVETDSGYILHQNGKPIPFVRVSELFDIPDSNAPTQQFVIVEYEGRKVGLVVDKVIGEHQTVIKPLGSLYQNVQGFSGATILGDGRIALIIDAERLIRNTPQ